MEYRLRPGSYYYKLLNDYNPEIAKSFIAQYFRQQSNRGKTISQMRDMLFNLECDCFYNWINYLVWMGTEEGHQYWKSISNLKLTEIKVLIEEDGRYED